MTTVNTAIPRTETGSDKVKQQSEPTIRMRDVVKVYPTAAGGFKALNGISLDIFKGEMIGILGKSGAGKSTLLNMISGVSEITSGEVLFNSGKNGSGAEDHGRISIHSMDEDEMALWRGRNLGIVYQSFELMPMLNLVDNVMLPQDFSGPYQGKASAERALELLDLVEISEHAYKLPAQVSGGQKQRVAIARALINDPGVILADEPTGNLDTVTAETIFHIFERLIERGKTIIMVTHDLSLASRFTRHVQISDGDLLDSISGLNPAFTSAPAADGDENQPDVHEAVFPQIEPAEIGQKVSDHNPLDASISAGTTGGIRSGNAIHLRNLVKTYSNAAGEFPALRGINLEIGYGQFVSIVGKSGSGKSTLLNMLTGIDHPTSGEVIIGGQNIYELTESKRSMWRGRNAGIVFQFFQLLPTLTLLENTMLPMDYCKIFPVQERPERAMGLLKIVGLENQAHKLPASVSSGQQQSVAIARALATDPPIILADEPTGNLDSRSAENIIELFSELAAQGKTILIVTHDTSITERTDQTVILSDGEIVDELVAQALPLLNHPQMLEATRTAVKKEYPPRTTIIRQGEPVQYFYLVQKGSVDILLSSPGCPELNLARLGPGQFFGEVELIGGGNSIASVCASPGEKLELALIPKEKFIQLLDSSPTTQRSISAVAQSRLEENLARNGDCE